MRALVELPTWLGDGVMASEALGHISNSVDEIILVGSKVCIEALKNYPKVVQTITLNRQNRYKELIRVPKSDIAISFRSHIYSKILTKLSSKEAYTYKKPKEQIHQVKKYHNFIEKVFKKEFELKKPKLYYKPKKFKRFTIGINPGATYGSAKRWYPDYFAKVINSLGDSYDFIIFGSKNEIDIANDIEKNIEFKINNLAGKTSIEELITNIAGLNLFITNDSGPMHIAAAYDIPTIAIFGPTNHIETSPFSKKAQIVRLNLDCAPCMKRVCPLKHHKCMKDLTPNYILRALENFDILPQKKEIR